MGWAERARKAWESAAAGPGAGSVGEESPAPPGAEPPPAAAAGTSPVPASPATVHVHVNVAASRGVIEQLIARMEQTRRAVERAKLSVRPVDLGSIVLQNQVLLMQAVAFTLDEVLALSGAARHIEIRPVPQDGGNGKVKD